VAEFKRLIVSYNKGHWDSAISPTRPMLYLERKTVIYIRQCIFSSMKFWSTFTFCGFKFFGFAVYEKLSGNLTLKSEPDQNEFGGFLHAKIKCVSGTAKQQNSKYKMSKSIKVSRMHLLKGWPLDDAVYTFCYKEFVNCLIVN
jgi:hypothetical protein